MFKAPKEPSRPERIGGKLIIILRISAVPQKNLFED